MSLRSATVISRILGALVLYIAAFLYEDEEGKYQNKLEELWIRIRYGRDVALSAAMTIFASSAKVASRVFDKIFGERLISFRVVAVSICFSIASFFLFVPLVTLLKPTLVPIANRFAGAGIALTFLALGLARSLFTVKWERWFWNACFLWILCSHLGPPAYYIFVGMGTHSGERFLLFIGILFTLSFACDLLFLCFLRWMMRRMSGMTNWLESAAFLVMVNAVAIGLVVAPFELSMKSTPAAPVDAKHTPLLGVASLAVILLNIVDLILCGAIFLILTLFVLHRLLWPLLERPLYAVARYGLVKRKTLLWTAGLALVVGPERDKAILAWLVEKVLR